MYKAQQDTQAGGPGDPGGAASGEPGKKDDVVDAEFTEVDDDKKDKKSA
jgi:molecular chaperone DnaK